MAPPPTADNEGAKVAPSPSPPRRKRKYRKALHAIRKARLDVLKTRVLSASSASSGSHNASPASHDASTAERALANQVLRRALQSRQREFARAQAQITEYALFVRAVGLSLNVNVQLNETNFRNGCGVYQDIRAGSPIERVIRLPEDEQQRMAILMKLQPTMLKEGAAFLQERIPRIDRSRAMHEDFGCEAANGDYLFASIATLPCDCGTEFTTTTDSRRSLPSARDVFDALLAHFSVLEIKISENLGHVTIREDDDRSREENAGILQNRLVSTSPNGVRMESNTVFFSSFEPGEGSGEDGRGYGLVVCNHIDDDARYPYQPSHRVRRDLSSVIEVAIHPKATRSRKISKRSKSTPGTRTSQHQADANDSSEDVVVVTRWVLNCLHAPAFPLPPGRRRELRETTEQWVHSLSTVLQDLQY
uniref:Uncharacterized protein n=1 Tax=Globisporangium ultimum (strain ATCC 200006 / CBS 805.95 / DAOM BR144) TaxID=431595 RepID=K3WP43_GLOUD